MDVGMGVFMIVGITALIYGIRYVLYKVFYAGADVIENAYKQKRIKGKRKHQKVWQTDIIRSRVIAV